MWVELKFLATGATIMESVSAIQEVEERGEFKPLFCHLWCEPVTALGVESL